MRDDALMVVVQKATETIYFGFFDELPDDERAAGPEEVGTVVLIDLEKKMFIDVRKEERAFRYAWIVTVIDHQRRVVIAQKDFVSGSGGDVLAFLKGLPREDTGREQGPVRDQVMRAP